MESQEEAYERLWTQPPSCFSESDIFEKRRIYELSSACFEEIPNSFQAKPAMQNKLPLSLNLEASQNNSPKGTLVFNNEEFVSEKEADPDQNIGKRRYNFEVGGKKIKLTNTSCFIFTDTLCLRKIFVNIVFWKYTNAIILFIIIANAIILGIPDYTKKKYETGRNKIVFY